MGLAAFNRMRAQRIEEMKPENIQKAQEEVKVEQPVVEEIKEKVEEPKKEGTARRGRRA